MKKIIFLSILLSLVFALKTSAQDIFAEIREATKEKDFQTAIDELQNLEKSDEKLFALNNYDYLLARMAENSGDFALAMAYFQKTACRNSILSEYAWRHLSQIARSSGNLPLERIYLQKLFSLAPESLLAEAAEKRLTRSYFESENFDSAIQILSGQQSPIIKQQSAVGSKSKSEELKIKNKDQNREDSLLLGEAFLRNNQISTARETFAKLIDDLPNPAQPDDYALEAAKNLDALDGGSENFGKLAPQLSETEHLRRASIYQFNRNFPLARLHFQAIIERFPASSDAAFAMYQIGRGYAREGDYAKAIDWFERVQAEFPNDPAAEDALTQTASAYARVGKPTEAVSRYKKYIQNYPNAADLDRAYLNIADVLRDEGEDFKALEWTAKTQADFKGKLPEALALFAQARIHISQNDWTNALSDLNALSKLSDLGGIRVPGGTNKAEAAFLKGFVLEQSKRYSEAIDTYLSIPDGRSEYYGWRASERLKALAKDERAIPSVEIKLLHLTSDYGILAPNEKRKLYQSVYRLTNNPEVLKTIKSYYSEIPEYQKIPTGKPLKFGRKEVLEGKRAAVSNKNYHKILADELLFLGLYDEATPELEISLQSSENSKSKIQDSKSNDVNYTLAEFYRRGDMANRAVAFAEPLWRNVPADYELELIPREQIELLYPAPYADSLLRYAPPRQIDSRFALSIMRQESRFRPDVKSNAAARGLMQFISTTADQIAKELGRENFRQDELYNPPTAILFGSLYLSNLFREFPDQPQAVAASYNGGEDNIARWLARAGSTDPDRYVSEIRFPQSKDYVYKVMTNYRVYQMFYDYNLKIKRLKDE